jgi:hypothetical protein
MPECRYDTDGDGDCHLCARKPGGCFMATPLVLTESETAYLLMHARSAHALQLRWGTQVILRDVPENTWAADAVAALRQGHLDPLGQGAHSHE